MYLTFGFDAAMGIVHEMVLQMQTSIWKRRLCDRTVRKTGSERKRRNTLVKAIVVTVTAYAARKQSEAMPTGITARSVKGTRVTGIGASIVREGENADMTQNGIVAGTVAETVSVRETAVGVTATAKLIAMDVRPGCVSCRLLCFCGDRDHCFVSLFKTALPCVHNHLCISHFFVAKSAVQHSQEKQPRHLFLSIEDCVVMLLL